MKESAAEQELDAMKAKFTFRDGLTLGTIAVMIALQWGFTSARLASAEERIKKLEDNDSQQSKDASEVKIRLTGIERDVQYISKDISKILEEVKKK